MVYLLLAVAAVVWIGSRRGAIDAAVFISPGSGAAVDLAAGLGGAAVLLGLWEAARRWLVPARQLESVLRDLVSSLQRHEVVPLALLSGFAEELFFRGAMQPALGAVLATLLFALLHGGRGAEHRVWVVAALIAGALFAALFAWRQTVLPPALAHAGVNLVSLWRLTPGETEG